MTDLQLEILDYEDTILAVKKGAAVLDEVYPQWEQAITVDKLFLSSSTSCVLGQLAPEYTGTEYADYLWMLNEMADAFFPLPTAALEYWPQVEDPRFEAGISSTVEAVEKPPSES